VDCDDGVGCTEDTCQSGICVSIPDDAACTEQEFCSLSSDCVPLWSCETADECEDGDLCTADACEGNLCRFRFCPSGQLCCPTLGGCVEAECCRDADCNDGKVCTVDRCVGGACENAALSCPGKTQCFEQSEKPTCSECFEPSDCDDGIACTVDRCLGGLCQSTDGCTSPEICDREQGECAKPPDCVTDGDCKNDDACSAATCTNAGTCSYTQCDQDGLLCCPTGCASECCKSSDCDDGIPCTVNECADGLCRFTANDGSCNEGRPDGALAMTCDPVLGCIECRTAKDCASLVTSPCQTALCVQNHCSLQGCAALEKCCPKVGCVSILQLICPAN